MKLHQHAASVLALSVLSSSAFAQAHFGKEYDPDWLLGFDIRAYDKADFDSGGDFGLSRWGGTLGRIWPGDEDGEAAVLSFRHEESNYDVGRGAVLFPPKFIEDTKEDSITANYDSAGDEGARWVLDLALVSGRSQDVSLSNSLYGEGAVGILFHASERFDVGIGVAGRSRIEEEGQLIPLPLVDWRPTDDLRFSLLPSADPSLRADYRFNERLDGYASVSYDERQFRLKDQNQVQEAAAVDTELAGLVGLIWHATNLDIELFGGVAGRNMELDIGNTNVADDDVDPTGLVGASLTWIL
jgi:hypothetical protein